MKPMVVTVKQSCLFEPISPYMTGRHKGAATAGKRLARSSLTGPVLATTLVRSEGERWACISVICRRACSARCARAP